MSRFNTNLIERAREFARKKHEGQKRKWNDRPYFTHPTRVAQKVRSLDYATSEMVCAAYLHDVLEDTDTSRDELLNEFGEHITTLVEQLTNEPRVKGVNREERKRRELEKIKSISWEAKVIKYCDRIDNLSEMENCQEGFKIKYVRESKNLSEALNLTGNDLHYELLDAIERLESCCSPK